jgi:hypothetical protein
MEKPTCTDCDPWKQYADQDIRNVMEKHTCVGLRRDVYDDPEFEKCKSMLKKDIRSRGFNVYEIEYSDNRDYSKYVMVDWSNSWTERWRDFKDQWGYNGVEHHYTY